MQKVVSIILAIFAFAAIVWISFFFMSAPVGVDLPNDSGPAQQGDQQQNDEQDNTSDTPSQPVVTTSTQSCIMADIRPGSFVASPLPVTGTAACGWYFEAEFTIELVDANQQQVAFGIATAQSDWMTTDPVPFAAELTFTQPGVTSGYLIFHKSNASGLPEHDRSERIPVQFGDRVSGGCVITGCSSHLCADSDMVSTCEYREAYGCYQTARCERQTDGSCGWTESTYLRECLVAAE